MIDRPAFKYWDFLCECMEEYQNRFEDIYLSIKNLGVYTLPLWNNEIMALYNEIVIKNVEYVFTSDLEIANGYWNSEV